MTNASVHTDFSSAPPISGPDTLIKLEYKGKQIRVVKSRGKEYWVIRDLAEIMGYRTPYQAGIGYNQVKITIPTNGGRHKIATVEGKDAMKIMYNGRRVASDEFKEWVNSVAIPTIYSRVGEKI